jgi:hypothetical protein
MEDPMPRPLRSGLIAVLTALCLALTACGSGDPDAGNEPTTPETTATAPTQDSASTATAIPTQKTGGTTIDITFKGEQVDPSGVERKVSAGKPFTLHIVADKAGEIHVHSSPEQEIQYAAGTTDRMLTIDQPGVVEVESHTLDKLIVQLEVR